MTLSASPPSLFTGDGDILSLCRSIWQTGCRERVSLIIARFRLQAGMPWEPGVDGILPKGITDPLAQIVVVGCAPGCWYREEAIGRLVAVTPGIVVFDTMRFGFDAQCSGLVRHNQDRSAFVVDSFSCADESVTSKFSCRCYRWDKIDPRGKTTAGSLDIDLHRWKVMSEWLATRLP